MVTSQTHSTSAPSPILVYALAFILLPLGGGLSYYLTTFLTQFPIISRFGIWLFGPATALIVLANLMTQATEEARWSLLLGGQAVGGIGILILLFGMF